MNKKKYKLTGLNCPSCASLLESDLEDKGIMASCSYAKSTLEVNLGNSDNEKDVLETVRKSGYNLKEI